MSLLLYDLFYYIDTDKACFNNFHQLVIYKTSLYDRFIYRKIIFWNKGANVDIFWNKGTKNLCTIASGYLLSNSKLLIIKIFTTTFLVINQWLYYRWLFLSRSPMTSDYTNTLSNCSLLIRLPVISFVWFWYIFPVENL